VSPSHSHSHSHPHSLSFHYKSLSLSLPRFASPRTRTLPFSFSSFFSSFPSSLLSSNSLLPLQRAIDLTEAADEESETQIQLDRRVIQVLRKLSASSCSASSSPSLIPCSSCSHEIYCSSLCAEKAWNSHHALLCASSSPFLSPFSLSPSPKTQHEYLLKLRELSEEEPAPFLKMLSRLYSTILREKQTSSSSSSSSFSSSQTEMIYSQFVVADDEQRKMLLRAGGGRGLYLLLFFFTLFFFTLLPHFSPP
jgi:hypothetical protein